MTLHVRLQHIYEDVCIGHGISNTMQVAKHKMHKLQWTRTAQICYDASVVRRCIGVPVV